MKIKLKILVFQVGIVFIFFTLIGCSDRYFIDRNITKTIKTADDWFNNQPEIIYIALRGSKSEVDALFKLIPMATKGDCTCTAGSPGDAAAIVLAREYELDPNLTILTSMSQLDRNYIFRYAKVCPPTDWEEEKLIKIYNLELP